MVDVRGLTFRSQCAVTVWATNALSPDDIPESTPRTRFDGTIVDINGRITMDATTQEIIVTLWNIGAPKDVLSIFTRDFLMAVDLARTSPNDQGTPDKTRAVIGTIKSRKIIRQEDTGDIGYQITAIPIAERLREVHIKAHFPPKSSPYKTEHVIRTLLAAAGIRNAIIKITQNTFLRNFVADGPIFSEIRRISGKTNGKAIALWTYGGVLRVSDEFSGESIVPQDVVLDAEMSEDEVTTPTLPFTFNSDQVTGEGFDVSQQIEDLPEDQMLSMGVPAPGNTFKIKVPLTPNIYTGDTIRLQGETALAYMGVSGVSEQEFTVFGVEHQWTSEIDSEEIDVTVLTISARST